MRIKRWQRRSLAIVAGLALGWFAAGFLPSSIGAAESHEAAAPATGMADSEHGGVTPADELVPAQESVTWLKPVLAGVVGLFAAACALGIPAQRWKAAQPSVPAPVHDAHGGHGH